MTERAPRYGVLLSTLVLVLLAHPVFLEIGWDQEFRLLFAATMVAICFAVGARGRVLALAVTLALPAGAAQVVAYEAPGVVASVCAALLTLLLLVLAIVLVMRRVLEAGPIEADRIAGAICVYLLLGLAWAMAHAGLWWLRPGAYAGGDTTPVGSESAFIYFSFTTLTTLGYGDLVPVAPMARTLAWLEALSGQLFLGVTIARLVGLRVAGRSDG
ncbi:MAG: potassium channel family protein [Thermoanaerobaculia bacterium]